MDFFTQDDFIYHTQRHIRGWESAQLTIEPINKGGSDRRYLRIAAEGRKAGPKSVILMVYTDRRADNLSYFATTEVLRRNEIRCPMVFAHDTDHRLAWVEDLGPDDLFAFQDSDKTARTELYQDALSMVGRLHHVQRGDVPAALESQMQPDFDESLYRWEQDYFFENFAHRFSILDAAKIEEIRQQAAFSEMASGLAAMPRFLVHRDFQSQNVIVRGGKTSFIDHQGLRGGRPEYDLASLLYDPYVKFTEDERDDLADFYFQSRPQHDKWDSNPTIYAQCACQRLMQALGAYGFLGFVKEKPQFFRHIPAAIANLSVILDTFPGLLPGLSDVLELRKDVAMEELIGLDVVES